MTGGTEDVTEPPGDMTASGEAFATRLCDDYREVLLRRGWSPPERRAFFEILGRAAWQHAEDEAGIGAWLQ